MTADPKLIAFLASARSSAIPHDTLVGLLTSQGWTEKEIYQALAEHYREQTGLTIPHRSASGTSAREAFFYLLLFSTLATWSIALACLLFTLIDRAFPDPLFPNYSDSGFTYQLTFSLAAVIVAYPLFLLVSRALAAETFAHPEKLQSPIRKWLTYLALVAAVCVFMGDLITALAYLLRGEITSRFLLKALVVLVLSSAITLYYYVSLRRSSDDQLPGRPIALTASVAVLLTVIFAFASVGTPSRQRDLRADEQRIQRLTNLEYAIRAFYNTHSHELPPNLAVLLNHPGLDPLTSAPFDYTPHLNSSQYDLCATFVQSTSTSPNPATSPYNPSRQWTHPAGHHCFTLDAATLAFNMSGPSSGR